MTRARSIYPRNPVGFWLFWIGILIFGFGVLGTLGWFIAGQAGAYVLELAWLVAWAVLSIREWRGRYAR